MLDESLATTRLRERRHARQARREAARRLGGMRPEQQAAARSEEERISRRLVVMEEVRCPPSPPSPVGICLFPACHLAPALQVRACRLDATDHCN